MATITTRVVRRAQQRGVVVLTRTQWGSRYAAVYAWRRIWKKAKQPADTVVQHISVTNPSGDFKDDARTIERIGYERFKTGFSYNFAVDMATGHVAVGQPLDAKGAHTLNDKNVPGYSYDQNLVARAIVVVGMPGTPLSKAAELAITNLLAAMVEQGAITEGFDYVPHSMFAAKDCPCDPTRDRMPAIRRAVRQRLSAEARAEERKNR